MPEIVRQCDAAAQSLAALEPSAEREVELSSEARQPPDFGAKDRMVNVPGPEKATKLEDF